MSDENLTPEAIWKELNKDVKCVWFIGQDKWDILNAHLVSDEIVDPPIDPTPPPSGPKETDPGYSTATPTDSIEED